MCIKIIGDQTLEYNPSEPLEEQIVGAREIFVNYEPLEYHKIDSFIGQLGYMVEFGVSCNIDIKMNANNDLNGIKLERHIDSLKQKLEVNEIAKGLTRLHLEADRKLCELSKMCSGGMNE